MNLADAISQAQAGKLDRRTLLWVLMQSTLVIPSHGTSEGNEQVFSPFVFTVQGKKKVQVFDSLEQAARAPYEIPFAVQMKGIDLLPRLEEGVDLAVFTEGGSGFEVDSATIHTIVQSMPK